MSQTYDDTLDDASTPDKFYLPAVATPPALRRVEAVLTDLLGAHGVVLIPDTYGK